MLNLRVILKDARNMSLFPLLRSHSALKKMQQPFLVNTNLMAKVLKKVLTPNKKLLVPEQCAM